MNPLTNMKNVTKLSEYQLKTLSKSSWHDQYKDSAWIFVGGLPYDLTEGDVICVFSQYGEIVNINLIRDKKTGKSKGFCFICYEDQRSTILAVDNLNGVKLVGRALRVDHVAEYKVPKEHEKQDEETKRLHNEGCAPQLQLPEEAIKREKMSVPPVEKLDDAGFELPPRLPIGSIGKLKDKKPKVKKEKKSKKEKKEKKRKHSSSRSSPSSDTSDSDDFHVEKKVKKKISRFNLVAR